MVVCESVVVNLVASLLLNGVCCVHSINEEEARKREQRQSLQKTVQVEWQRQRLFDKELQEQEQLNTLQVQDRRKCLMEAKMKALSLSSSKDAGEEAKANEIATVQNSSSCSLPASASHTRLSESSSCLESPSMIMSQRHTRSTPLGRVEVSRRISRAREYESDLSMSSLMDELEDEDEDEEPFEEVTIP